MHDAIAMTVIIPIMRSGNPPEKETGNEGDFIIFVCVQWNPS